MQYRVISKTGATRLIVFFLGWGMDAAPFENLRRFGYDIALVWDYKSFDIDWSFTAPYCEVCVMAWSMGVFASAVTTVGIEHRITRRMAVNGTLAPVDNLRGIPEHIFNGTLESLNERNLAKFRRRMCGSAAAFDDFIKHAPARSVSDLDAELHCFHPDSTWFLHADARFDLALICRDDAIFPPANQWRAWQGTPVQMMEGAHLPDFQAILDRYFIDKNRVEERFGTGLGTYAASAAMQQNTAQKLAAKMSINTVFDHMARPGARTLEIGSGTGMLSRIIDKCCGSRAYLEMWDIAGSAPVDGELRAFRRLDAEIALGMLPRDSFDVIASASTVQWFNSPSRFLSNCLRALAPGGYLAFSAFQWGNLSEVEEATGRGLPLLSVKQWLDIIPQGFQIISAEDWNEEIDFDEAVDVFRHLKATGVNALGRTAQGESPIALALRRFPRALHGKFRITYRPFLIICKKL